MNKGKAQFAVRGASCSFGPELLALICIIRFTNLSSDRKY